MPRPGDPCPNCGATLRGSFCHRCGQEAVELRVPLRRLMADGLGDLVTFDSRIVRTLRPLFLRPGFLTAEWIEGRRVRYVPPLRLYFFVAAVFFVVLTVTDVTLIEVTRSESPTPAERTAAPDGAAPEESAGEGAADGWWEGRQTAFFQRFEAAVDDDVDALQDRMIDRLGTLSLLLPPVLGVLLALLYRRRHRVLVEHMVFSFHVHSFAFVLFGAMVLLPMSVRQAGGRGVATVLLLVYGFIALRRVYGGRRWVTAGRMGILAIAYLAIAFLPALLLALIWAVLTLPAP